MAEVDVGMEMHMKAMEEFLKHTNMEVKKQGDGKAKTSSTKGLMSSTKPLQEELGDDMYPCILAMLGSGFGYMMVGM